MITMGKNPVFDRLMLEGDRRAAKALDAIPKRHHAIPIKVWVMRKREQQRRLLKAAKEYTKNAKHMSRMECEMARAYRDIVYKLQETVLEIERNIMLAQDKHNQRANAAQVEH